MRPVEQAKPTIHIVCAPAFGRQEALLHLCHGIEEEGLPYEIVADRPGSALALAVQGSEASRLDVGIGLDGQDVVLHFAKLPADRALFEVSARAPDDTLRALGANGARLVKKLPFKPLER